MPATRDSLDVEPAAPHVTTGNRLIAPVVVPDQVAALLASVASTPRRRMDRRVLAGRQPSDSFVPLSQRAMAERFGLSRRKVSQLIADITVESNGHLSAGKTS